MADSSNATFNASGLKQGSSQSPEIDATRTHCINRSPDEGGDWRRLWSLEQYGQGNKRGDIQENKETKTAALIITS